MRYSGNKHEVVGDLENMMDKKFSLDFDPLHRRQFDRDEIIERIRSLIDEDQTVPCSAD